MIPALFLRVARRQVVRFPVGLSTFVANALRWRGSVLLGLAPKKLIVPLLLVCTVAIASCSQPNASLADPAPANPALANQALAQATFAGGCFWCMEKPFDQLEGVVSTTSGYTGGQVENPTYQQVSAGRTGHTESVRVLYDPKQVGYDQLLKVFWHNVDPLDAKGQFCDKGSQYRSGIFYETEEQRQLALASKADLESQQQFQQGLATEITAASEFYPAEDYHQNYYQTNPVRYNFYRKACGRDRRLTQIWGDQAGH
ncbi:MAG: peptide-methionine (S)-S-oxide reductase MsrA [Synechococcales cyanobacterium RM1_1_8]|nr:peptide-methionine (S)-S-oxide reductase MsrA [Synechococcales cyanobacterium RM1_1_8]